VINFWWTSVPTLPSQTVLVSGVAFQANETEELQNGGLGKNHTAKKSEVVKRSETKTKTRPRMRTPFIVNSLLFFMDHRQKSTALDSTFQMMLNYYNEETISEAKALLHNKIAPEKGS